MKPLAAVLALLALGPLHAAPAPCAEDATSVDWVADDGTCRCRAGNACWHYLRAPVDPPADPCWCNYCVKVSRHDGTRAMPENWSEICASNQRMECFLKRHAASWKLTCSECLKTNECACRNPHPGDCPQCEKGGSPWDQAARTEMEFRLKRETELFASRDVVIVQSPHYYVVTDIPTLKLRTQAGVYRVAGTHELAHIYAERCEKARRDFVRGFTDEVGGDRPSGVFLPKRESTAAKIQARYNSSPRTNLVYGGGDTKIADGTCFNGFCTSLQGKGGGDDEQLHHGVRHMIGHLCISCWTKVDGKDRVLPRWLFEGVAHWLAKLHPLLEDRVVWCADEGTAISGSGKDWEKDARKFAGDAKIDPVERLLEKSTIGLLTFEDHVRAWSYIHLAVKEDREPFLKVMRALRAETANRQAWMEGMSCTPDEWDQRWKDRLAGRRPTFGPWAGDKDNDEGPGAADRRALRAEQDMQNLVARIRSIGICADPKTAGVMTDLFARESDAVREVLTVILAKTTEPKALEAIRLRGLGSQNPVVRAYAARVLGLAGDASSLEDLRKQVGDEFWLARAEAALALMRLKDPRIVDAVRPMISDQAAKARIAAMDAVATAAAGIQAEKAVAPVAANLDHESWQVRSAAAECLGGLGSMYGVEPLIARMTSEAGRLRVDCYDALKRITKDDLGKNPENWSKWWKKERERVGGGVPEAPKPAGEANPEDARYGRPERPYGIQTYEGRVGYMLDMSNSMFTLFEPDPSEVKRLRRKYVGATKFDISREEIAQSIAALDPRAKFNVMVFSTKPRFMSNGMSQAGGDAAKKAEAFLKSCRSSPESAGGAVQLTSFYDAFRGIFDLPKGSASPPANFTETPDTMFFLTDGEPTAGEIIDADELLAWFNGLNRYARIRVNVIAYGNMGIDLVFLGHLAGDNGGTLFNIAEAKSETTPGPGTTPK
jgi:hypothetical protein